MSVFFEYTVKGRANLMNGKSDIQLKIVTDSQDEAFRIFKKIYPNTEYVQLLEKRAVAA
ncbi:MAG: hypothetical protein K9M45_01560 [Kiritimatiellales bacterium]|nr:hypothetical protein [Kiritimatiellales bacterium]